MFEKYVSMMGWEISVPAVSTVVTTVSTEIHVVQDVGIRPRDPWIIKTFNVFVTYAGN